MPTNLDSLLGSEMDAVYKEAFLTDSINAKFATFVARGIYTGFRLTTNVAANVITVEADADGNHAAIYETSAGRSLSIRRTGGNFNLTIPITVGSTTYAIAIFARYALGTTTLGTIRAYQVSPVDELTGAPEENELIILGTVTSVAGGGVIPENSISASRRTSAAFSVPSEVQRWVPLIHNGDFENGVDGITEGFFATSWEVANTDDSLVAGALDTVDAFTGDKSYAIFANTTASLVGQSCLMTQTLGVRINPYGRLRVKFRYQYPTAATVAPTFTFRLRYQDIDGPTLGTWDVAIPLTSAGPTWQEVDEILEAKTTLGSTASIWVLEAVQIRYSGGQWPSTGAVLRVDDVQVWVERPEVTSEATKTWQLIPGRGLMFSDPNVAALSSASQPVLHWNATANQLRFERRDLDFDAATQPQLALSGPMVQQRRGTGISLIAPTSATTLTLIGQVNQDGSGVTHRTYISEEGAVWRTLNAEWTGAGWQHDFAGAAIAHVEGPDQNFLPISLWLHRTGVGAFTMGDWDYISTNGSFFELYPSSGFPTIIHPEEPATPATATWTNTLYPSAIPKAWAYISVTAGPAVAVTGGMNIASVSLISANQVLNVQFATPFAAIGDYCAVVSGSFASGGRILYSDPQTDTSLYVRQLTGAGATTAFQDGDRISVVAFGAHV